MPTDYNFIVFINNISTQMSRYVLLFTFLFGIMGNVLNILVFSQRSFRSNPCAICFLYASVSNLTAILSGVTSRMLNGWSVDLTNTNRFICKFRSYILNVARPIAFWLILLAIIDRWLVSSTNIHYRQISTMKNAVRSIIMVVIFAIILFSHIIYCYEPNMINTPLQCYGSTIACQLVSGILFTFVTIFIPVLLMLIFGLMTINNIRHVKGRIQHVDISIGETQGLSQTRQRHGLKKMDYRMFIMLFAQILLLFIFGLPLGIEKLYETITINRSKTKSQIAITNFVYNFVLLLNFLANGMPFYIYTLFGGTEFRKALFKIFSAVKHKIFNIGKIFH
ncbi:unnamed protein product [Rotaria magnacalcarata]|uniref:G-protein coupled receptors family 1 profile domain-containing protein n=2 Tax=Rotaria magnacalcarata TaxID=392030 RepID=A0A817AJ54_9BILA|nr:unnamed protein product [Rotaria magnacalcarata]